MYLEPIRKFKTDGIDEFVRGIFRFDQDEFRIIIWLISILRPIEI